MRIENRIGGALDSNVDHSLRIRVTDTSGDFVLTERVVPIQGIGSVPPPAPHLPGPVIDGPITLPATQLHQANGRIAIDVAVALDGVSSDDDLIYNVRLRRALDGRPVAKFAGRLGTGFGDGEVLLTLAGRARQVLAPGDYTVQIDIFKNRRVATLRVGGADVAARVVP